MYGSEQEQPTAGPAQAGGPDVDQVAGVMARIAGTLQREHGSVDATLQAIIAEAVREVPGASSAGIIIAGPRQRLEAAAASDDLSKRIDALQLDLTEGPSLDVGPGRPLIRVDDVTTDRRWPRLRDRLGTEDVRSILSLRLSVPDVRLGALTLYSSAPAGFDEKSEQVALLLARHAAVALVDAQQQAGLRLAIDHRDVIGQAKGMLMERYKLPADQAFRLLVHFSQHHNIKLYEIAEQLAATGQLAAPSDDEPGAQSD